MMREEISTFYEVFFVLLFSAASWSQAKVTDTQVNRANMIGSQHGSGTGIMETVFAFYIAN